MQFLLCKLKPYTTSCGIFPQASGVANGQGCLVKANRLVTTPRTWGKFKHATYATYKT